MPKLGLSFASILVLGAFLIAQPVLANGRTEGPNGGKWAEASGYHLELVAADGMLTVYVYIGPEEPVASEGGSGSALVLANKNKAKVTLSPADENIMTGEGDFTVADGMKVVVTVNLANGDKLRARFAYGN